MGRINVTIRIFAGTLVPNICSRARRWSHRARLLLRVCERVRLRIASAIVTNDGRSGAGSFPRQRSFSLRDCTCTGSLL